MKKLVILLLILILVNLVSAEFDVYSVSEEELAAGVQKDLKPGDQAKFVHEGQEYYLYINTVYSKTVGILVSSNKEQYLGLEGNVNPNERKFELNFDEYYDLSIKLDTISISKEDSRVILTIKRVHELVPENTILPYSCFEAYACDNGKKLNLCKPVNTTVNSPCRCRPVSDLECEEEVGEEGIEVSTESTDDTNETSAICGNEICEPGEESDPGGCGPDADPSCLGPPASEGSCPEDCDEVEEGKIKLGVIPKADCPTDCLCDGITTKCFFENGREMTILAGESGNIIIQSKTAEMRTSVELYKNGSKVIGNFEDGEKEIRIFPDDVKNLVEEKVKAIMEEQKMTLKEDGKYYFSAKKKAKFLFILNVNERIKAEIDSNTGVIKIKNSIFNFLSNDIER